MSHPHRVPNAAKASHGRVDAEALTPALSRKRERESYAYMDATSMAS